MQTVDMITVAILLAISVGAWFWLWPASRVEVARRARPIAVDGTNVMFWRDDIARITTLRTVLLRLRQKGFEPMVFFDASSRHHLGDRSLDQSGFAKILDLPRERVTICPRRTEADTVILRHAGKRNIAIVSNDRFRDHPRAARNIRLVKGRFEGERLILKGL